jgi:hypothetical protein
MSVAFSESEQFSVLERVSFAEEEESYKSRILQGLSEKDMRAALKRERPAVSTINNLVRIARPHHSGSVLLVFVSRPPGPGKNIHKPDDHLVDQRQKFNTKSAIWTGSGGYHRASPVK